MIVRQSVSVLVVGLFMIGCGDRQAGPPPMSVRDSADVRIVEYADLSADTHMETGGTPVVSLGGGGGGPAEEFYRVRAGGFLSDGSFVVVNGGSQELRRFAGTGEHLASYGLAGDGPEEFRRLAELAIGHGDSIFAYDAGRRRVTVLSRELAFGREVTFQGDYRNLELGGLFEDHRLMLVDNGYPDEGETPGFQQFQGRYLTTSPLGEQTDTIGWFPWYRLSVIESGSDLRGVRAFFNEPTESVVSDDVVWVGTRQRHEIEGRDASGRLRTLLRWPERDRAVRPEDIESWKRVRLAEAPPEQREETRSVMDRATFSDVYPTHAALLAAPEGGLWVEQYRRPTTEGPAMWWVFDRDGELQSTVELPQGVTVLAVLDDRVLVLERDELDVELVRVYDLVVS